MAFDVILKHPTNPSFDLNLGASDSRLEFRRAPLASALPGEEMIITDLGQITRTIVIAGTCEVESDEIATRDALEDAAVNW